MSQRAAVQGLFRGFQFGGCVVQVAAFADQVEELRRQMSQVFDFAAQGVPARRELGNLAILAVGTQQAVARLLELMHYFMERDAVHAQRQLIQQIRGGASR